jgi:hypothetical protein
MEFIAPGFVYSVLKNIWGKFTAKRRNLTNSEIVELRKKWKAEIEPRIAQTYRDGLRKDVIIRDMKHFDSYPDIDDNKKGISPWFRVGLVGTYHRGIQVGLSWEGLKRTKDGTGFRRTNYKAGETGDVTGALLGLIPFENVENIDRDGDEYYGFPHIYCFFSHRKQPYEHLGYYTQTTPPHGIPFFTEIATYDSVRRLTKKARRKPYAFIMDE